MKKYKIFLNFSKEEKWLRQMAEQGWMLTRVDLWGAYYFEKAEPQKHNYRVDYRSFSTAADFDDYVQLFHDSGWLHVAGLRNSRNQYFVQMSPNSTPDIFSDAASRAGRYKRLSYMMLTTALVFLPFLVIAITQGMFNLEAFTDPKSLWLTPGLWEMGSAEFWPKFLFEMPFALGRGFLWCFWLIFILGYVVMTIKSWLLYRKTKEVKIIA